jgi:hypothetical protein
MPCGRGLLLDATCKRELQLSHVARAAQLAGLVCRAEAGSKHSFFSESQIAQVDAAITLCKTYSRVNVRAKVADATRNG